MRLIDADALRDKLQKEIDKVIPPFDDVIGSIRCGVRLARNIVEDEPTVDAEPVKHGEWRKTYLDHEAFGERPSIFYCSACCFSSVVKTNYCPNCGAKMDERKE